MGEPCLPFRADPGHSGVLVGILEAARNKKSDLKQLKQSKTKQRINVLGIRLQEWIDPGGSADDKIWFLSISWLC